MIRISIFINIYCTISINTHHGFLTCEGVRFTLTASKHISGDGNTFKVCGTRMIHIRIVILSCMIYSIKYFCSLNSTDIHECITRHICQFTTTIYIFRDVGAKNILWIGFDGYITHVLTTGISNRLITCI